MRGSQPTWMEKPMERGLMYRRTEETALCSTGHIQNGILFIGRGLAFRKTEETDLCWTSSGRNEVLLIGRGVAYRKTEETDLCWSAKVEMGVLFIGRSVVYRKTGVHGILFISTVDLLQPPPATVHPWAPIHLASTARYSTGYCSTIPLHGLLFNHPSTGYCSSSPPPSTVHPALHRVVLFIEAQPARSIGVLFIQRQHHGVLFIHPHRELFIQSPSNAHCSSRGSIDRLQLAAVAKESLDRV